MGLSLQLIYTQILNINSEIKRHKLILTQLLSDTLN